MTISREEEVRLKFILKEWNKIKPSIRTVVEAANPRQEVPQREYMDADSMPNIIKDATAFAQKWGKTINDVFLEHEVEDDYGSTSSRAYFRVEGLETDVQYYERRLQMAKSQDFFEKRDREEYARLKAKFEK